MPVLKLPITAAQLGTADRSMHPADKTFVPARAGDEDRGPATGVGITFAITMKPFSAFGC